MIKVDTIESAVKVAESLRNVAEDSLPRGIKLLPAERVRVVSVEEIARERAEWALKSKRKKKGGL